MAPNASYTLASNIDASGTSGGDVWGNSNGWFNATFVPIGMRIIPSTGTFNGMGHIISGLTINLPNSEDVGLFGITDTGSVIKNVGLVGGNVSGSSDVGALVGRNSGSISTVMPQGSVTGSESNYSSVGGLVGANYGSISSSYSTAGVSGYNEVGGLVGYNAYYGGISNSYATGSVSGYKRSRRIGRLQRRSINSSYATGSVSGNNDVGGLVGYNYYGGSISNSYATGSVSGNNDVGGLVGYNDGAINNTYAVGSASVNSWGGDAGGVDRG